MLSPAVPSTPATSLHSTSIDPWLTIDQAAKRAQVHVATCRRAIKANRLRAIRVNAGRVFRLRASWVDAWLENSSSFAN